MGLLTTKPAAKMKTDAYTECRGVGRIAVYDTETNRIWSRFISRKPGKGVTRGGQVFDFYGFSHFIATRSG